MEFISLASGCVSCVGFELFSCKVYMRSATIFLQACLSLMGSCAMVVSVSNPRFCIQFPSLARMFYLGPFVVRTFQCSKRKCQCG